MKYQDFLKNAQRDIDQIITDPVHKEDLSEHTIVIIDPMEQINNLLKTGKPSLPKNLENFSSIFPQTHPIVEGKHIHHGKIHYIAGANPYTFIYPTNMLEAEKRQTSFQSIDPILGFTLFSFYHELGHALEAIQKKEDTTDQNFKKATHYQDFLSECCADLFSIITLAKKGRDLEKIEKDILTFRISSFQKNKKFPNIYNTSLCFPYLKDLFKRTQHSGHSETFKTIFSTLEKEMDIYKSFFEEDNNEKVKTFQKNQNKIAKNFMKTVRIPTFQEELKMQKKFEDLHPEYDLLSIKIALDLHLLIKFRPILVPDTVFSPRILLDYIEEETLKTKQPNCFPKNLQKYQGKTKEDIQNWYKALKKFTQNHPKYSFLTPHIETILKINDSATKLPDFKKEFYFSGNPEAESTILDLSDSKRKYPLSFLLKNKTQTLLFLRPPLKKLTKFTLTESPVIKNKKYAMTFYITLKPFLKENFPNIKIQTLKNPLSLLKKEEIKHSSQNQNIRYIGFQQNFLKHLCCYPSKQKEK